MKWWSDGSSNCPRVSQQAEVSSVQYHGRRRVKMEAYRQVEEGGGLGEEGGNEKKRS